MQNGSHPTTSSSTNVSSTSSAASGTSAEVKCYFNIDVDEDDETRRRIIVRCENVGCDRRPLDKVLQEQKFIDGNWRTCKFQDFADTVNEMILLCHGDEAVLPDSCLSLLPDLERLHIHGGDQLLAQDADKSIISIISDREFRHTENLTRLHLDHLAVAPGTIACVKSASKLQMITITNCDLIEIASDTFRGLRELWSLKLGNNKIAEIQPGAFDDLINLSKLELQNNRLLTLPVGLFKNTQRLANIDLSGNMMKILTQSIFEGATAVVELDLRSNQIEAVEQGAFEDFSNLEILYMDKNAIMSLPKGAIGGENSKLNQVSLARNEIQNISWLGGCGINNVTFLDISSNKIILLPEGIFGRFPNLVKLNMKNNLIASIPDEMFWNAKNLTEIDLRSNKLEKITQRMFKGLEKVECLNLIANKITSIEAGAFNDLVNLKQVFLQQNKIDWLPDGLFSNCKSLFKVDLTGNPVAPAPKTDRLRHFGRKTATTLK